MAETITYQPDAKNAVVRISLRRGKVKNIRAGDSIKRGEIPEDVFDYLAGRADFAAEKPAKAKSKKSEG